MKKIIICLLLASVYVQAQTIKVLSVKTTVSKAGLITHSATLSCTPPAGNISGYNFYRGTVAGGENYGNPLNGNTPVSSCGYVDSTVVGNGIYFFTAEAICLTCTPVSSGPSNEAKATIPGDPQLNPPGSLTVTSQ